MFLQLQKNGVHELASLAVERVSWGLAELGRVKKQLVTGANMQPMSFARAGLSGCDMDVQGAVGSEAMQPGAMHDTVMGNTGMLLLEDPGLQSFVPEAFAPLTWALGRDDQTRGLQAHRRVKQELKDGQKQAEYGGQHLDDDAKATPVSTEAVRTTARSSGQMRGGQGSAPGSAPTRYATFDTAPHPSHDKPQGPTSPLPTPGPPVQQQRRRTNIGLPQLPPPHLRHHSYPSIHHTPIPPVAVSRPCRRQRNDGPGVGILGSQDANMDMTRVMPHFSTSRPFLHTLPDSASTSATAVQPSPNVHPSWAARSAIPISSVSEPALDQAQYLTGRQHMTDGGHCLPTHTPHDMRLHTWQYTLPFNMSSATGESAPATAEQMEVEEWRRFMGGNSAAE